jgi:hypothetical protein
MLGASRKLQHCQLLGRNLLQARLVEAQVRLNDFRRGASEPLIERDILEDLRGEHFQEDHVGVAGVLDVVTGIGGDVADVIGVKVDSAGVVDREEDGHASLAGDPELPFCGVRMPMQLPHSPRA